MFIDAHCHLEMVEERGKIPIADAVSQAKERGVRMIVTNGVNADTNKTAIALSEQYDAVQACAGLYPIDALELDDAGIAAAILFIRENKDKIIGIGEVGMDFSDATEEQKKQQRELFRTLIALSIELDKPVIVHSRKAEKECIDILEEEGAKKVLMHCFCGKISLVERIVQNGWHVTIPTNVKHSEHFQRVIETVPLEQLFCETDAPYLHPDKTFPNQPKEVVASYQKIAEIKDVLLDEVEERIEENAKQLFGLKLS